MMRNKKAFMFSTSGLRKMRFIHNFDKPLKKKLQGKGFDIIGEFSCRGYDTSQAAMIIGGINNGRPNARDLKQAEDFASGLKNA
jgi:flavodoxin